MFDGAGLLGRPLLKLLSDAFLDEFERDLFIVQVYYCTGRGMLGTGQGKS
jgi:hypothetical protein